MTGKSWSRSVAPRYEHPDGRGRHDRGGQPSQRFQPRRHGKLPHDGLPRPQQHDHDRYRRDPVDDRAPEQRLNGIEGREIKHSAHQCRSGDRTIEGACATWLLAMPLGSSSDAPVIRPGPKTLNSFGRRGSVSDTVADVSNGSVRIECRYDQASTPLVAGELISVQSVFAS